MFNGKRQATAAMAIAVGFLVAPGAQAAWFGFGSRPATPPAVTLAQAGGDAERVNQLETQVRNLTGQVETLQHQLEQLQTQLQAMQADNEFRFSELSGKGSGVRRRHRRRNPIRRRSAPRSRRKHLCRRNSSSNSRFLAPRRSRSVR